MPSPKIMDLVAVGAPGIIGPIFLFNHPMRILMTPKTAIMLVDILFEMNDSLIRKKPISRSLGGFNLGFNQENLEKITRKWPFCAAGSVLHMRRPLA